MLGAVHLNGDWSSEVVEIFGFVVKSFGEVVPVAVSLAEPGLCGGCEVGKGCEWVSGARQEVWEWCHGCVGGLDGVVEMGR